MKGIKVNWLIINTTAILSVGSVMAQEVAQPVIATARYKFSHQIDTTNSKNITVENTILYIGKSAAMYFSYDKLMRDSMILYKSQVKSMATTPLQKVSSMVLYYFQGSKKWYRKDNLITDYLYPITFPHIVWTISSDEKTISGLKCQKATGNWMGRTYIAWFSKSLPFSFGPWKLNGLPGLIVEAYDTKREVLFEFTGFEMNKDARRRIGFPSGEFIYTNEKDFERVQNRAKDDPIAFTRETAGVKITMPSGYVKPKSAYNNPVELTNKN